MSAELTALNSAEAPDVTATRTRNDVLNATAIISEPPLADELSSTSQPRPHFQRSLKRNTNNGQYAVNHTFKLDQRNSISIESDPDGMLMGNSGSRNCSQLPFLISRASNFFQAVAKPLNVKNSGTQPKACTIKKAGQSQYSTIRGRGAKE